MIVPDTFDLVTGTLFNRISVSASKETSGILAAGERNRSDTDEVEVQTENKRVPVFEKIQIKEDV